MTTRREAAAVRLAEAYDAEQRARDVMMACDDASRVVGVGAFLDAGQVVEEALAAYRATIAEPAPALDPLTAATVAKLRAAADALERGEVPAGVAFGTSIDMDQYPCPSLARDDANTELQQTLDPAKIGWIRWRVVVDVQAGRVTRRWCEGDVTGVFTDYALVDPDAWTEPALDVCDVVGCEHCGGPGGGA